MSLSEIQEFLSLPDPPVHARHICGGPLMWLNDWSGEIGEFSWFAKDLDIKTELFHLDSVRFVRVCKTCLHEQAIDYDMPDWVFWTCTNGHTTNRGET